MMLSLLWKKDKACNVIHVLLLELPDTSFPVVLWDDQMFLPIIYLIQYITLGTITLRDGVGGQIVLGRYIQLLVMTCSFAQVAI